MKLLCILHIEVMDGSVSGTLLTSPCIPSGELAAGPVVIPPAVADEGDHLWGLNEPARRLQHPLADDLFPRRGRAGQDDIGCIRHVGGVHVQIKVDGLIDDDATKSWHVVGEEHLEVVSLCCAEPVEHRTEEL